MSLSRRDWLRLGLTGAALLLPRRARAFGEAGKIIFGHARHGGNDTPRPHALRRLAFELMDRTSLKVSPVPRPIDLEGPELFETPFLYLAGDSDFPALSDKASGALRRFLAYGGFLFADSADGGDGFDGAVRRELAKALPEGSLQRVPNDHVLYKSFYLIDHQGGRQIVAPYLEAVTFGGRLAAVYSKNDLGGAWSRDDRGDWEFPVEPGGDDQREQAFRMGVNLAMYATCLDYKDDQVHLPFILKRRR